MAFSLSGSLDQNLVGKDLISDQFKPLGQQLGAPELPGGTEFTAGGQIYRVEDTGHGGRRIVSQGSEADRAMQRANELTQQAIGTLQSQQPKIAEIYQGKQSYLESQIDPIKARYTALINDIKGQQTTSEEQQTLTTSRELAKRGITNTSGYSEQELQNVLNPIRRTYAGLTQETGLAQEADIKAINDAIKLLAGEQSGQEISLAGLIAQAMQGGASNAQSWAANLLQNAQAQAAQTATDVKNQSDINYQNQLLAMQEALQPAALTKADLENQALLAAINKAKTTGTTPESLVNTTAGTATTKPFNWTQWGLDLTTPQSSSGQLRTGY